MKRHNDIVERIKRAAMDRWEVIGENQKFGAEDLRPDLVLKKDNDMLILDVTVQFENYFSGCRRCWTHFWELSMKFCYSCVSTVIIHLIQFISMY